MSGYAESQKGPVEGMSNLEQCVEQFGGYIMGWPAPAELQKGVAGHSPLDK